MDDWKSFRRGEKKFVKPVVRKKGGQEVTFLDMVEVVDTNRFGRRSGLGEGRGLREGEIRKSVRAEKKTAGRSGGGDDGGNRLLVKTDAQDLRRVRRARAMVICIEETRNDYSDEVIRELKRIYASAGRMIKEYEKRKVTTQVSDNS